MDVLVIGSGGREHAICWALAKSPRVRRVYAAPGNPGIATVAQLAPVAANDIQGIVDLADQLRPGMVVVGPEAPLAMGAVDALAARGHAAFGPTRAAARIEWSKAFAKELMMRAECPRPDTRYTRIPRKLRRPPARGVDLLW